MVTDNNEKIFLGDEDGQIVEIDFSQRLLPEVPAKLVVGEKILKQKNSSKNMKKIMVPRENTFVPILEESDECRTPSAEIEGMLSNFDNSDLWTAEITAHLEKRKSPTPMAVRTRAGSADLFRNGKKKFLAGKFFGGEKKIGRKIFWREKKILAGKNSNSIFRTYFF